jgi:hypothetical protein
MVWPWCMCWAACARPEGDGQLPAATAGALRDRFIGVNPFEQLTSLSSFQGMRQAMEHHVKEGNALAVFPAAR